MKAADAKREADRAAKRIATDAKRVERAQAVAMKKAVRKALTTGFAFSWKETVMPAIKKAIRLGRTEATFTLDAVDEASAAKADKIVKKLQTDGYVASKEYQKGTDDMGDFNAPCTVHWERYYIRVSWLNRK